MRAVFQYLRASDGGGGGAERRAGRGAVGRAAAVATAARILRLPQKNKIWADHTDGPMQSLKFNSTFANSKAGKTLKRLETQRMARVKATGARLVKTIKHADLEARASLAQDLKELADVAAELLAVEDSPAAPPPADQQ